jgi:hypothetical protein
LYYDASTSEVSGILVIANFRFPIADFQVITLRQIGNWQLAIGNAILSGS